MKILNLVIFIIPEKNILQLFLLLWVSLVQRFVWIVLFPGISHNAYETVLESGTDKHVSITILNEKYSKNTCQIQRRQHRILLVL
jgi:hypothetical protein